MGKKQKTPRYVNALIVWVASVLLCVLACAAYFWMAHTVRALFVTIETNASDLELLVANNAHSKTVRSLVRDTVVPRAELDSFFVRDDELVALLEDFKALGAMSDTVVSVSSVRDGATLDKDKTLQELTVALSVQGSFADIIAYLKRIENYPKVLLVEHARITHSAEDGVWSGLFTITLARTQ